MDTNPIDAWINLETRRQLFGRTAKGLSAAALAALAAPTCRSLSGKDSGSRR